MFGAGRFDAAAVADEGGVLKTAGVVIDDWKLPIFKRHLDAAECKYTEHPGITPVTLTLRVQYEWLSKLKPIIEAANEECRNERRA